MSMFDDIEGWTDTYRRYVVPEEKECSNGHGPMEYYEADDEDIEAGLVSYWECPECGERVDEEAE